MSQLFILKYSLDQGFLILRWSLLNTEIYFIFTNSFGYFESVQLFLAGVSFSQIKNMEQEQGTLTSLLFVHLFQIDQSLQYCSINFW